MTMKNALGVIDRSKTHGRIDHLYRVSIKSLIRNENGEVLVVKEAGRSYWDLPGGGMDHGEDVKASIAREMKEEVNLEGDFVYEIIAMDEPAYSSAHDFWQVRLIFALQPDNMNFIPGDDGDEVAFIHPDVFKSSLIETERRIYNYIRIISSYGA